MACLIHGGSDPITCPNDECDGLICSVCYGEAGEEDHRCYQHLEVNELDHEHQDRNEQQSSFVYDTLGEDYGSVEVFQGSDDSSSAERQAVFTPPSQSDQSIDSQYAFYGTISDSEAASDSYDATDAVGNNESGDEFRATWVRDCFVETATNDDPWTTWEFGRRDTYSALDDQYDDDSYEVTGRPYEG